MRKNVKSIKLVIPKYTIYLIGILCARTVAHTKPLSQSRRDLGRPIENQSEIGCAKKDTKSSATR